MNDPRVPDLARRLHSGGYLAQLPSGNDKQYQGELVKAVKAFQLSHSLQADGVIGAGTVAELNISPAMRREQLRINLERFRWLAQDLEPEGVVVNVAAAQLSVYQSGIPVWQTRLQVGRYRTPDAVAQVAHHPADPQPHLDHPADHHARGQAAGHPSGNPEYLRQQNLQVLDAEGHPLTPRPGRLGTPGQYPAAPAGRPA